MSAWIDANLFLIQLTLVNFLLALSLQVPIRTGVFSFASLGTYGIGGYTSALMVLHWQSSAIVALIGAALLGGLVCVPLALALRRLGGLYLGMATISFALIVGIVVLNGGELTGGATGLFGVVVTLPTWLMLVVCVVVAVAAFLSERGRIGRRVEAAREDPELAGSAGIDVARYRLVGFVAGGVLGALAGSLTVMTRTTIGPSALGFQIVVLALMMVIIGGTRSWIGALVGAVIFTWLPSALESFEEWHQVIYGVIVVVAAIYLPGGLHGVVVDAVRRWRRRELRSRTPELTPSASELTPVHGKDEHL